MRQTIDGLRLIVVPKDETRGCGYSYLIQTPHYSHVAFRTLAACDRWLSDRGLTTAEPIPERILGQSHVVAIDGAYTDHMMQGDRADLAALGGFPVFKMSNGQWTKGVVTSDDTGHRTVHYLNPNNDREVFDWRYCQTLEDAGHSWVPTPTGAPSSIAGLTP